MKKLTIKHIQEKKCKEKLVCITAYDSLFANIFDEFVDLILVGDSLNMSFNGKLDTLDIGLKEMIYHSRAVCRGAKRSFIVGDMPFGSYNNLLDSIKNATKYYKETKVDALKIEGSSKNRIKIVKALSEEGIAVVAHIGLMPQFGRAEGGYFVKGKDELSAIKLVEDSKKLEEAGAVAIVLEGIKSNVARDITSSINIPTIGIGAGSDCDGQILVWSDAFGLFDKFKPKFVRYFLESRKFFEKGIKDYSEAVRNGSFPNENESY